MKTIEISKETRETLVEVIEDLIANANTISFEELLKFQAQGD